MAILFGIDGTGATNDNKYRENTADSFVRRLCEQGPVAVKSYERGPTTVGFKMMHAIRAGVRFIKTQRAAGNDEPILLTGHSRGAAGVVVVAERLQEDGIDVHALMLFDCVDRHIFIDASVIPNNVGKVLHIRRDRMARSRESFGNDGTRWNPPTNYEERFFVGTHGAMGGTFWKPEGNPPPSDKSWGEIVDEGFPDGKTRVTFAQDKNCSEAIWANALPFLRDNGFWQ